MKPAVSCSNCALYHTARVLGLDTPDCSQLDEVVLRNHPVAKNEFLYQEGNEFRYLYLIHSGACVSLGTLASGREQVMSYYLPGEIAGIESIGRKRYDHSAQLLESGSVCQLDYLGLPDKVAQDKLIKVLGYLLRAAAFHAGQLQWERSVTGLQSSEQRVTAFLLNMSARFAAHAMPSDSFRLPMSRDSIADYLGLATETVIRVLKKLESKQLVAIKAKQITLINKRGLNELATCVTDENQGDI